MFCTFRKGSDADLFSFGKYRSTGAPDCARLCPVLPGPAAQAEPIPTTNPHAQVTKMAFAWSKNQTPSNYYDYYYYYYYYYYY